MVAQNSLPAGNEYEGNTLPDLLAPGLDLVFVGLNPSEYSARQGHYFANPRNRFWAAFNRSALLPADLRREPGPNDDSALVEHGIGFTDVVKRPTPQGSGLKAADYRRWAPVLREKLLRYQPRLVCFHGQMAYRAYLRYAEEDRSVPELGLQPRVIGVSAVFVVPNPSPANARYSVQDLAAVVRRRGQGIADGGVVKWDATVELPEQEPGGG